MAQAAAANDNALQIDLMTQRSNQVVGNEHPTHLYFVHMLKLYMDAEVKLAEIISFGPEQNIQVQQQITNGLRQAAWGAYQLSMDTLPAQ